MPVEKLFQLSFDKFTAITNCVLENEKISSLKRKYNIRLTVGLDGPESIHDLQRVFPNGEGMYKSVFSNSLSNDGFLYVIWQYIQNLIIFNEYYFLIASKILLFSLVYFH